MFCGACGSPRLDPEDKFCTSCGVPLTAKPKNDMQKEGLPSAIPGTISYAAGASPGVMRNDPLEINRSEVGQMLQGGRLRGEVDRTWEKKTVLIAVPLLVLSASLKAGSVAGTLILVVLGVAVGAGILAYDSRKLKRQRQSLVAGEALIAGGRIKPGDYIRVGRLGSCRVLSKNFDGIKGNYAALLVDTSEGTYRFEVSLSRLYKVRRAR